MEIDFPGVSSGRYTIELDDEGRITTSSIAITVTASPRITVSPQSVQTTGSMDSKWTKKHVKQDLNVEIYFKAVERTQCQPLYFAEDLSLLKKRLR